jgi:hypothetical protein
VHLAAAAGALAVRVRKGRVIRLVMAAARAARRPALLLAQAA